MKEDILEILYKIKPEQDFDDSKDFVSEGILDSFDLIELISEIEDRFNIVIDGMDVLPENFSNLEQIEELIKKSGFQGKV